MWRSVAGLGGAPCDGDNSTPPFSNTAGGITLNVGVSMLHMLGAALERNVGPKTKPASVSVLQGIGSVSPLSCGVEVSWLPAATMVLHAIKQYSQLLRGAQGITASEIKATVFIYESAANEAERGNCA